MTAPKADPQATEALSLVAKLHRQANGLRAELSQLRENLAQAQVDFNDTHGARLLEANESLVMAVLRAEAAAETAVSDLGELACSSERDAMLRVAIDSAHIGEWELDLTDGTIRHSLRYDMCFGHEERQAEWNVDILLARIHPDDRPEFETALHHARRHLTDWQSICRVVWPDASVHWVSIRGGIRQDADRPARLLGIITEVTGIKLAEEAHKKLAHLEMENRQMLEASKLKSQFISNMSHELRTPLNAIIGFSDLLYMGAVATDSPKQREFLGHIRGSARHLLHLINDVLDLSKIESGKFQFYPETVDLKQLVSELVAVLHTSLLRNDISLEVDIAASLQEVTIDPARLKQVLYNYLSNAIKFTAAGGRVTVRILEEGEHRFRLEVEDTGIGISEEDLPRLFIDFQQLDTGHAKLHQGTGLGLALTRRLVQAQGGLVGVRSTLGVGSVFHVVLNRLNKATA